MIQSNSFRCYQSIMGKISCALFYLLIASLPYPHSIQRPLMVAWFAFWVLEMGWLEAFADKHDWRQKCRQLFPMIGMGLYAVVEIASLHWSISTDLTHAMIERHLAFLLLPLVAWGGLRPSYKPYCVWLCLILSAMISLFVYTIGYCVYLHIDTSDIQVSMKIPPDQNWTNYWELIALKYKHRLFYSMTMLFAMIGLLATRKEMSKRLGKRRAAYFQVMAFAVLLLGIYFSGSRQALLTLYLMLAFCLYKYLWNRRFGKAWFGAICMVGILGVGAFIYGNPRSYSILHLSSEELNESIRQNGAEPRIGIWQTFLRHCDEIPWYGVGAGTDAQWLHSRFVEDDFAIHAEVNFHSHNQFFSLWIDLGLWMAVMMTCILILYFLSTPKETRPLAVLFEIMVISACCTDTLLDNIEGTFLVAIGMLCIMLENRKIRS